MTARYIQNNFNLRRVKYELKTKCNVIGLECNNIDVVNNYVLLTVYKYVSSMNVYIVHYSILNYTGPCKAGNRPRPDGKCRPPLTLFTISIIFTKGPLLPLPGGVGPQIVGPCQLAHLPPLCSGLELYTPQAHLGIWLMHTK